MIINGNLTFSTQGAGELQNAVLERLNGGIGGGTLPAGTAGRIVFNVDDNQFYGHDGTSWSQVGSSDVATLADLTDMDLAGVTTGDVLIFDGANWVNVPANFVDITGDTMTGDLVMAPGTMITLNDPPLLSTDVANKQYVDSVAIGTVWKQDAARVASTADIDLTTGGLLTIDGITLVGGDRVLAKNQSDPTENGIYVADAGSWTRATDFDSVGSPTDEINRAGVFVQQGLDFGGSSWVVSSEVNTIGVDPITWSQISGASNTSFQYIYDSTLNGGPNTTHTVPHNLGQQFVVVNVYETNGPNIEQAMPQEVILDSANQLTVLFDTPIDCYVVVMGIPGINPA
jgi:hypothetical protein